MMRLFCLKKAKYFNSAVANISLMIGPALFLFFALILSLITVIIINTLVFLRFLKKIFIKLIPK